jgi:hypothetical protein
MSEGLARFSALWLCLFALTLGYQTYRSRHRIVRHKLLLISSPLLERVPALIALLVQCAQFVDVKHCYDLISFLPAMKVGDLATTLPWSSGSPACVRMR